MIKKSYQISFFFLMLVSLSATVFANVNASEDQVWLEIEDSNLKQRPFERGVVPNSYKTYRINKSALQTILSQAPMEFTEAARNTEIILSLPMPDGSFQRFRITESPIMEPGLAEKFPEIKTYSGQGIDDPTATARFDWMPSGFHSQIISTKGTILVDSYFLKGDTDNYISYAKNTVTPTDNFICEFKESKEFQSLLATRETQPFGDNVLPVTSGATLRTYRLALAATGEYSAVFGGTIAGAQAAQVVIMNRVNGVYEKDLTLRMVLIANNDLIIYTNGGTDPYTNNNGSTMLGENQTNIDTVIGSANYDIGHVFSTGGGGVAQLNSPCGPSKARGVTGLPNPVGDAFSIDYVAHEMGHQWGSNHTFNTTVSSCAPPNRSNLNSVEPGSGITIMAYAGICGNQNLAPNSIDTFHIRSLEVIVAFSQTGNGNTCDVETATGNTPPAITIPGGSAFNIPKQTPFSLTASATDVNGDSLTYDWQQFNAGGSLGAATTIPNNDADGIPRPLFRNYLPSTSPTRFFPSLQYIRNNANVPPNTTGGFLTGELLPAITRTMNFHVLVRDNRAGGGGVNSSEVVLSIDGNSGPFNVTAPNTATTFAGNSTQTVTWNVANTTAAPVSAANVKISFSADGGLTFPTTILASTANDGSEAVTVPNVGTTQGRIKIEAVGNVFFDMSDANFTVTAGPTSTLRAPFDYDGDTKTDLSIFRPSLGQWWYYKSSNGGNAAVTFGAATDKIVPGDYTGDQKTDFALFRASTGQWFVLRSEDFSFFAFPLGVSTDVPAPADYDGDGKTDAAVYRPSTNNWFINKSSGGTDIITFGASGDVPAVGNYDGDNKADIAIYRPSLGQWWIRRSSDLSVYAVAFGTSTDKPVQGDYTGDGKTDIAFWRSSTSEWYIVRSENASFFAFPFGISTDTPVPGDYDGDGKTDAGVFRSSSSTWFVQRSTAGTLIQAFGLAGDIPTPNAYVP